MVKFINLKVGGAITPINVEDVVKVKGVANGGNASTITLTYFLYLTVVDEMMFTSVFICCALSKSVYNIH